MGSAHCGPRSTVGAVWAAAHAAPLPSRAGHDRAGGNVAPSPRRVYPPSRGTEVGSTGPPPRGRGGGCMCRSMRKGCFGGACIETRLLTWQKKDFLHGSCMHCSVCDHIASVIGSAASVGVQCFCFGIALFVVCFCSAPRRVSSRLAAAVTDTVKHNGMPTCRTLAS